MQLVDVQMALAELGQVDILLEMVVKCLVSNPDDVHDKAWFEKLENALVLLETTYKSKKTALVSALQGGITHE